MLPMVRQAHHEVNPLRKLRLILSLSKDEAKNSHFFSNLLAVQTKPSPAIAPKRGRRSHR